MLNATCLTPYFLVVKSQMKTLREDFYSWVFSIKKKSLMFVKIRVLHGISENVFFAISAILKWSRSCV